VDFTQFSLFLYCFLFFSDHFSICLFSSVLARIRAEILLSLDDSSDTQSPSLSSSSSIPPAVSQSNLLINELIRDYLSFNGYRNTLSVFAPESGTKQSQSLTREFMSQELHIHHNAYSKQIPLLYSILALLQQGKLGEMMKQAVDQEQTNEKRKENEKEEKSGKTPWQVPNPLLSSPVPPVSSVSLSSALPHAQFPSLTPGSFVRSSKSSASPMAFSSAPSSSSSSNGLSQAKSALRPSSSSSSKTVSFHSPVAEVETVERLSYSQDDEDDQQWARDFTTQSAESYEEEDFYEEERD
jgi:lisH domain-containing protein FOPNL